MAAPLMATRTPVITIRTGMNRTTYLVRFLPTGALPRDSQRPVTHNRLEFYNAEQADDGQVGLLGAYLGSCRVEYLVQRLDQCELSGVFAIDYSNIPGSTAVRAAVWARQQQIKIDRGQQDRTTTTATTATLRGLPPS